MILQLLLLMIPSLLAQFTYAPSNPNIQILPQCQCIANPSGTGCLQYDSRFQAATLEEAMMSFPDLSLDRNDTNPEPTLEQQAQCTTKECLDCQEDMRKKLQEVGLFPTSMTDQLIQSANMTSSCNKYRFSQNEEGLYTREERSHDEEEDDDSSDSSDKDDKSTAKRSRRSRRQALPPTDANIVGQRFTMSCSAKGVATDSTGLVSLCSSCWVWRKLPDNYTPQYINELVCDNTDNSCLSGYASCGIGHRSMEVVRNDNGVATTIALTAGSYCECKIAAGSALSSLVTGGGVPPNVLNNSIP